MKTVATHTFHIPVMGLGFTIDTPLKVARFGISSVLSIVEDELIEQMREFYSKNEGFPFVGIKNDADDYRAKRITAYLDLVHTMVDQQMAVLRNETFETGNDIVKYFELLPSHATLKKQYLQMLVTEDATAKTQLQQTLRNQIQAGAIDVNIMAKIDGFSYTKSGEQLPKEYCSAMAALRGFANSKLQSSVVLSAGYNPQLYAYVEQFSDFFPDKTGVCKKKIILKVSDYRSALTQGKLFAKKGVWISEFRIESGLNCGGHAFATDGLLLGPIMEEFKQQKDALIQELFVMCNAALSAKNLPIFAQIPQTRITVQGGIGTANEDQFLLNYYQVDGTGWGSPFLLVPEATNVDEATLHQLATAKKEDYYLSNASPLGVPFNNFRKSTSETQRLERIEQGRPGSPCTKKHLCSNTEFTERAICTASRKYQFLKLNELNEHDLPPHELEAALENITIKDCLCEGLSTPALLKNNITPLYKTLGVAVCPGPNLAYFSGIFSLKQMVGHIYGKFNLLNNVPRSNLFVNELNLYVSYLKTELDKYMDSATLQKTKYFQKFKTNLLLGIDYYKNLFANIKTEAELSLHEMIDELNQIEEELKNITIGLQITVSATA